MDEVYVKWGVEIFTKICDSEGPPFSTLLEGVPYSEEQMRGKLDRISWEGFHRFLENAGCVWNNEQLEDIGIRHSQLYGNTIFYVAMGFLLSIKDIFKWTYSPRASAFTSVKYVVLDLGKNHLQINIKMKEGYKPSSAFFYISKGAMKGVLELLNIQNFIVDMRIEGNLAYYDVKYSERAKIISKFLHIIKWPYKTLMAGRELIKTTDLLQTAYLEIVESRNNLEKKVEERTAELKQAQAARDRFFANISHEFRTPLTLILGPSEEIISEYPDEKLKFKAGLIKKNANRLLNLVNQLLDLSKIESGGMVLKVRKTNLIPYLKGIFFSFESLAKQKQITLQFYSGVENIDVYFDSQKMEQVFNNLISNAIKFTPIEGKVIVTINLSTSSNLSKEENGEGTVGIKVKDTGVGIPNDQLDYVFNRFYQVNSSYEGVPEGTGIGLALTKELVELHYGKITVKSEENKGTEFIVTLPLGKTPFKEHEIDSELITPLQFISGIDRDLPDEMEKEEILEQGNTFESEIILIVEDNKEVRKFIKKQLEPTYKIIEAVDGEDGFGKAADSIPDLIISDVMMPVMDGNEFCKKIRNDERTSHIPVIILTAKGGEESKLEGLETGADDYLIKPFSSRELMIRVRNLIEQRKKLREKFSRESFFKPGKISASSIDVRFITRIREAIEKNISNEKFSVENLASEIALSRVQLHRKLKALTNHSASDFILKMRLDRAADLLKKNAASISEIAYMTGFNTPNYFAKRFKKQFGCSPSEYKKPKFVDPE